MNVTESKFPLGDVVATAGALAAVGGGFDILEGLDRHQRGDWGDVCQEDKKVNDDALNNGGRLLSAYHAKNGTRFWIITEWDRSVTTVLLPEDY